MMPCAQRSSDLREIPAKFVLEIGNELWYPPMMPLTGGSLKLSSIDIPGKSFSQP